MLFISIGFSQITFRKSEYEIGNCWPPSVTIEDIDNDCLNDVIFMTNFSLFKPNHFSVQIFKQNLKGELSLSQKFQHSTNGSGTYATIKVVDFNSDNLKDIILNFDDSIKVFYQSKKGTFENSISWACNCTAIKSFDIGDINNDGLTDFAFEGESSNGSISNRYSVFYQKLDGTFLTQTFPSKNGYQISHLKIANINNDCYKDIVATGYLAVETVFLNQNEAKTKVVSKDYTSISYYPTFRGLATGHYSDDCHKSIFLSTGGNKSVNYQIDIDAQGNLSDSFRYFSTGDFPSTITFSDFNNDGFNEIVCRSNDNITIYEDSANVRYNPTNLIISNYKNQKNQNPNGMAVGDLNNDGLQDIAIVETPEDYTNGGNNYLKILINTSKPKKPFLNNSKVVHSDCPSIKWDTINEQFYQKKKITDLTKGCAIETETEYKISNTFISKYGFKDSLYYKSFCQSDVVYLDKNKRYLCETNSTSDTISKRQISKETSFPISNYSIVGISQLCENIPLDITLVNSQNIQHNMIWYWQKDSIISNRFTSPPLSDGKYSIGYKAFIQTDSIFCSHKDSINLLINKSPGNLEILGIDTVCTGQKDISYLPMPATNYSMYNWTILGEKTKTIFDQNSLSADLIEVGKATIFVQETNKDGCKGEQSQKKIFVNPIENCLLIPNIITPNHDGYNDIFDVKSIEKYPINSLKIYNRLGSLIFESLNYKNTWDANNVPDGLYYYSFEVDIIKKFNGWVLISR